MDLTSIDFVEDLHEDEGVEDDGVVFGWGGVQGGIPATVNVKDILT